MGFNLVAKSRLHKMKITKPTFTHLLLLIAIGIIVIGSWKGCGDKNTFQQALLKKEKQRKEVVDSIQSKFALFVDASNKQIQQLRDSNESLLAETTVLRYERDQAWVGLGKNKKLADDLIARIKSNQGKDSADCLELTEKYTEAAGQVVAYKIKSDQLIAKLDTTGRYKDEIIKVQKTIIDTAIATNKKTKANYDSLYASFMRIAPSASFSGGFTALGNKINPISGAGIAGLFTQKNGNSIGVNALMMRDANVYFQGTYVWRFSLRKK